MLEVESPMGQCFSRFLTVSQRSKGEGEKEKGRYGIDKKIKNRHKPVPHLLRDICLVICNHHQI